MSDESADASRPSGRSVFTIFGTASSVLGVLAVVGVVLAAMIWHGHHRDVRERAYETSVLRAAAQWTGVLINMNSSTVAKSMQTLHDGTVGQLNANFESAVQPFSQVVQKLQSQTVGQVESVSIESLHHLPPGDAGRSPQTGQPELAAAATRTDTVLVVATSVSQNAGAQPLTVHWTLRLGISSVNGTPLVSSVETVR